MRRGEVIPLPDWSAVRKVLLIRLRSIGDTVLMTPCLTALKAMRPEIKIAVVSEPLAAPVIEDHPLVDRLLIAEKSLGGRARLIGQLRRARYDIAFDLHGGTTASGLARFAGARWSVGYEGYRHSRWLDLRAPDPDVILGRKRLHSVEQQLALLHWAGVPWPVERPQLSLAVSSAAEDRVHEKLKTACVAQAVSLRIPASMQSHRLSTKPVAQADRLRHIGDFAVIAPAAAFESKRWTAAGFAEVARHLRDCWQLPSVVIAGPGQEPLAKEVAAQAGAVALGGLTLKELIALINGSRAFVGNDGGPMHIAAALRRPLVAVFGSSNPAVWQPWTDSPYQIVGGQVVGGRGPGAGGRSDDARWQKDTDTPDADGSFAIRRVPASEVTAATDDVLKLALAAS